MVKAGGPHPFGVWDFTIARIPILIVAIAYMVFIGYRMMPDIDNSKFHDTLQQQDVGSKLSPAKEGLALVVIALTIGAMLFENVIGIPMYLSACVGAVVLVLAGVLTEQEALASIHQPTVFLFAGVLALSDAIRITGAGDVVADWMIRLLGNTTNPYIIMAVFYIIPFILTQIMSNLATYTIFIPLVASACVKIGVDPRADRKLRFHYDTDGSAVSDHDYGARRLYHQRLPEMRNSAGNCDCGHEHFFASGDVSVLLNIKRENFSENQTQTVL